MNTKDYLICYDIKDKKRLSKLAKYLEKIAYRIQYSIFLLPNTNILYLQSISDEISNIISHQEDDLRIYTIKTSGYHIGQAVDLNEPFLIL
jgi:CRISPR-associated protein Cas2